MAEILTSKKVKNMLPVREKDSHKGDYGKTLILAGSKKFSGAAFLAAAAAIRGGCGYTTLGIPEKLIPCFIGNIPEVLLLPFSREFSWKFSKRRMSDALKYTSIAIGMGMETTIETAKIICFLLKDYKGKLLIDADGLNSIAANFTAEEITHLFQNKACEVVLTPHPMEFSRLTGIDVQDIRQNGEQIAHKYAADNNITVLLKGGNGSRSVITNGKDVFLNATGNSGMAKAGSGDVLSGLIASIASSGANVFQSACAGAYIAGKAAEFAAKETSEYALTASDEIAKIGEAFLTL